MWHDMRYMYSCMPNIQFLHIYSTAIHKMIKLLAILTFKLQHNDCATDVKGIFYFQKLGT